MSTQPFAQTNQNNRTYLFEIHFLRALACMGVVGVHLTATHYGILDQPWHWLSYFFNQYGRFGTTIFAVLSGFLLFYQVKRRGFMLGKFIKSRFTKILIPFLVWSVVYRLLGYAFEEKSFGDPASETVNLLLGNSYYHLYFVAIVLQFYLVFPIVQKLISSKILIFLTAAVSLVISVAFYEFDPNVSGMLGEFLTSKAFLPVWIFYFVFGCILANYWEEILSFTRKNPWIFLGITLLITIGTIVEYKVVGYVSNRRLTNILNIPLLCISLVGLYPFLSKFSFIKKPLTAIGKYSMGIYLVHPLILFGLSKLIPQQYWTVEYLPLLFAAVMLYSTLLIRIIQLLPLNNLIVPVPAIKKNTASQLQVKAKKAS
ncbi:acyltransferase [Metabacillus indicus]|uniref:acyltransferase n=1 Tax=Metabacillus indicus TaxID=246786 RepID=UPI0004938DEA|nr:acyltransferase [Metabacillus indicus]KEZ48353.1 hypothetical protein AZ46_0215575 [Metabacillus indicus LMG 22858]